MTDTGLPARANPRVLQRLVSTSLVAGLATTVLALVVIVGWLSGVTELTTLSPGQANMKFNTAAGLALAGFSIVAIVCTERPLVRRLGRVSAGCFGLLGVATLVEYATGRSLGFDNPFGFDHLLPSPGRIATTSAVCFIAVAVSVLALDRGHPRVGQFAGLAVVSIGLVAVVGYAFDVVSLYKLARYAPMSLQTAVAFVIVGLALLAARPGEGVVVIVTEDTAGGITLRRTLIPAIVGPAVVGGLLDWAARSATLTPEFRLALFTVAMIVLSTTLVWVIGSSLRHVDLRRAGAEEALDQLNQAIAIRRAAEVSVARLAAVVEQSSDAILTLDLAGVIIDWNRGAEEIYGYRDEEVIGQKASSILAPAGGGSDRDSMRQQLDLGQSIGRELTVTRADGRIITVSVTSSPILDAAGQLVAVSSISRDISDQKAVELALRDSELRMKTSLDNMLDGFAILRSVREGDEIVDFEWTYINPIGAATYGRRAPELIGARMLTVTPGIEASGAFDEYCEVVTTGQPRERLQMAYQDETLHGVFDLAAWKLDDGFAVTWQDVTDREQARIKLQSSEDRFRASVEHLHEALSVFSAIRDGSGTIVDFRWEFANSAASLITGLAPDDLVGQTLMEVLPDHGPSGMLETYRQIVETGEAYVDSSLWYEDVWGDGRRSRRAFDVRATKIGDGFVVVTREVTQQREQEARLDQQRQELERSNTEMRRLNQLADELQSCATARDAYSVVTRSCADLFSAFSGSISIMHPSRETLDTEGQWGDPVGVRTFGPAACLAVQGSRPFVSQATGPRCTHLSGSTALFALCVPMVSQGDTTGVVHLTSSAVDDGPAAVGELEDGPPRHLAITVAAQLSLAFANLRLRDSLREMSIRDPLTGLFNRRYMEETLDREMNRAARTSSELGLIMIDVDHFKAFNDTHGHEAGDAVLEAVGNVLRRYSRTSDVACRFGGEEFVMILPDCSLDYARLRADELRRRVAALYLCNRGVELPGATISCGVAAFPMHGHRPDDLIHAADSALYIAKRSGRNQVALASIDEARTGF